MSSIPAIVTSNLPLLPYLYLKAPLAYSTALQLQTQLVQRRLSARQKLKNNLSNTLDAIIAKTDILILLEHPPTYTIGRRDRGRSAHDNSARREEERLQALGAEYFEVEFVM